MKPYLFALFIVCNISVFAKQCFLIEPSQFLCRQNFKSGKLKSIEFIGQGQLVPNSALYLYENQRPLAYMNWQEKQFIHFDDMGNILQRLDQNDYSHYQDNQAITHCIGAKCSSQKWSFVKLNPQKLQIGDVIFSGNLSIYAGTGQAQFTHISIFAGYKNGIAKVLGSDMAEKIQISNFDDSIFNPINFAVLRSKAFQKNVKTLLENQSYKHQNFCSELFRSLVNQSFKSANNPINDFASIHPETLLKNNYHFFDVIDFKLQSHKTLEDFFQNREAKLNKQVNDWHQIVSSPQDAMYQIFAKNFIFLPLVFSRQMMESMIRFSTSGIFKETNPLLTKINSATSQNPIFKKNKTTCFATTDQKKLCFYTDENLKLLSFEVFSKSQAPDMLLYLKNNQLSHFLKFGKSTNTYFQFDKNNQVKSRLINNNYLEIENQKVQLRCKGSDCTSTKYKWVEIDKTKLQAGDVIFTGSTYPYSANQKSLVSHVSIVEKTSKGRVFVLSNDIYKPIQIVALNTLNKNLHSYFVLRNQKFTQEFKKFRRNSPLNMAQLPYFCANLYFTIFKKSFPDIAQHFDEMHKNHAETAFLSTYQQFDLIDFKSRVDKPIHEVLASRKTHLSEERKSIENIMKSDKNLLYRLFQSNLSLLPFTLPQKRVHDLLKFMQFYSD
ncbi:MAG: hypothetical protein KC646_03260 [Candidatus Cloacimonetes bacterium]|nr:hypothetical protein [Candidatus Cloacimonadota bacterium]